MRVAPKRRGGFTLLEIAVAAVILAMLAAVTAPYLVSFLDNQRAQTAANELQDMSDGIGAFAAAVKTGTAATSNTYPGFLSQLANSVTTAQKNSCNNVATRVFNATATSSWITNGPFVTEYVPSTGFRTPIGTINDSLIRSSVSGTPGTLAIQIASVDTEDVDKLDQIVDGGDGLSKGRVQWSVAGGIATVSYFVPVGKNC